MSKAKPLTGAAKRLYDRVKSGKLAKADLAKALGKLARETTTDAQREAARVNGRKGGRKPAAKKR